MLEFGDRRKRKRFALLVSLLVHTVFFALCYLYISPIKVYILDNVREVVIVSDHELIIPPFDDNTGRQFSALTDQEQIVGPETLGPDREAVSQGSAQSSTSKMSESQVADSNIASTFNLGPPDYSSPSFPRNFSLSLSPRGGEGMSFSSELKNYRQKKPIDFSKYGNQAPYHPVPRKSAFSEKASYDLGPWAEKVVASVQKLWFLKPSQMETTEGQIKVSAVIGRKGELLSARIVDSSPFPLLEDSALNALKMSAPFPSLPEAFPGENLEILLVFWLR